MYIYDGGHAVQHEQFYDLGALVVVCKNWSWAALVHAAARLVALTGNNALGPPLQDFMTWKKDDDTTSSMTSPIPGFTTKCDDTYKAVNNAVSSALNDIDSDNYEARVRQSHRINEILIALKQTHQQEVNHILHPVWE